MTYEEFDRMLDVKGNALVNKLALEVLADQLSIERAARKAASWHVQQMRRRYGGRYSPQYFHDVYKDLYETALHDFPYIVERLRKDEPLIIPRFNKPVPRPY